MDNFSDTPRPRFLYLLFRGVLLCAFSFGLGFPVISQIVITTNSYKSNLTPPGSVGDWNVLSSWLRWDGDEWVVPTEIPGREHDVFIQKDDEISLSQNQEVGNLYLFGAEEAGPKLNLQDHELDVYGALRSFDVDDDGDFILHGSTSLSGNWIYPETGTIVFRGASRTVVDRESWSANNLNSRFKVVFDPDPGAELVVNAGFKASDFLIRSGTVIQTVSTNANGTERTSTFSFNTNDEFGSEDYGEFRIASGATLISEASAPFGQIIRRSESKPASSFVLEEGASLVLLGEQPVLDATEVQFDGEVRYASTGLDQFFLEASLSGSELSFIYTDIFFEGAAVKWIPQKLTVTGDFIYLNGGEVDTEHTGFNFTTITLIGENDQVFDVPNFTVPGMVVEKTNGTLFFDNPLEVSKLFEHSQGFIDFQGNGFTLDFDAFSSYKYLGGAWANLDFFEYNGLPLDFNDELTSFPFFDTQFGVLRTVRLSAVNPEDDKALQSPNEWIRIVYNESPGVNDDPGFVDTDGTEVVYHLNSFFEVTTSGDDPSPITIWILSDDLSIESEGHLRLVGDGEAAIGEHLLVTSAFGSLWTGRAFDFNEAENSLFTIGSTSPLSVLPIEWFGFESTTVESGELLSWTTSIEENVTYVVSRAEDNHLELRAIGTVDGEQGLGSYSFLDSAIPEHLKYGFYQITAIKDEVPISYSDLIRVDFPQPTLEAPIIFPNPYSGGPLSLQLKQYATFSKVEVQVLNSQGILMLGTTIGKGAANDYLLNQLGELEPGYYLINFFGEGQISTFKWIKLSH